MRELIVFVLLGLGPAALIAGLAVALVVQYRGSGVINLAAGAIATFGAYAFYSLDSQAGWAAVPAIAGALGLCVVLGLALELILFRRLRSAPPLAKLVASLGLLLTLQAVFVLAYGPNPRAAPAIFSQGSDSTVQVFGSPIPTDRLWVAAIVVLATVLLSLVYRYTRIGLSTRAAAENEGAAMLLGLEPVRVSLYNTVAATVLAAGFGILVASQTQLDASTISLTIVPALAGALLGGFTSFAVSAAAGMAIGIGQTILVYAQARSWLPTMGGSPLPGVAPLFSFVVVVGALWLRGAGLPTRGMLREERLPAAPEAPAHAVAKGIALTVIAAVVLLIVPAAFRQAMMNSAAGIVICLSLVVIVGYVGQISLMQVTLAGVAAFAVQKLSVDAGIPFPLSPILAVGVAVLFGLAAAVPSLRLRGVTLAIGTLAAAVAIERFVFNNTTFGQDPSGSVLPAPDLFGLNLGPRADFPGWDGTLPSPVPGLICLLVTLGVALFVVGLRRSTFGQHMLAVRSNESAAASEGVNVRNVKIAGFAIAAGIAGVGGVMAAYSVGTVNAADFGVVIGLTFVAFAYLGGITTVSGAIVAGTLVPVGLTGVALQEWTSLSLNWLNLIGGVMLIYTILFYPQGIALATTEQARHVMARLQRRRGEPGPDAVVG